MTLHYLPVAIGPMQSLQELQIVPFWHHRYSQYLTNLTKTSKQKKQNRFIRNGRKVGGLIIYTELLIYLLTETTTLSGTTKPILQLSGRFSY